MDCGLTVEHGFRMIRVLQHRPKRARREQVVYRRRFLGHRADGNDGGRLNAFDRLMAAIFGSRRKSDTLRATRTAATESPSIPGPWRPLSSCHLLRLESRAHLSRRAVAVLLDQPLAVVLVLELEQG